ncbi:DUF3772 domain-containing protein [Rhizobium sp. RU36D]|uniref:DUF3772 domain-containing protein n=1 Tax=Rhizobium sp. RU36D TaxID=1907415 RepID=UPI0009D89E40|nr:DUF3772 domain-containing protein [Rhizobium sp. RU36D]SMD08887.1 Small-conductance mechanosensitive channel [Rhizobium sp. RU36D]
MISADRFSACFPVLRLVAALLFLLLPVGVFAQQQPSVDQRIAVWNQTATRAEEALKTGLASTSAFELLRQELAGQRAEAEAMIGSGNVLVRSLNARIGALGPPPGKDQTEPEPVAAVRKQLTDELAAAEAPVIAARQAQARANVLIETIDALVRSRETTDLLMRSPSPLLPSSWLAAFSDFDRYAEEIALEFRRTVGLRGGVDVYMEERLIPGLALLLATLLGPLVLGHLLLRWLERRAGRETRMRRYVINVTVIHLLRLTLSLAAMALIISAYLLIDIATGATEHLGGSILVLTFMLLVANWLGNILFSPRQARMRLVALSDSAARHSYLLSLAFGLAVGLEALATGAQADFVFSPGGKSVLSALIVVLGSLVLFGLSRVLLAADGLNEGVAPDDDQHVISRGFVVLIARAMQVAAILALACGAIGYVPLASQVLLPTVTSLALFGLAYILHHATMSAIQLFEDEDKVSSSLMPIAIAAVITLACMPLLALIWGARLSDLSETWRLLSLGFDLGGTRISFKVFVVLALVFLIGLFVTRWLQRVVAVVVLPKTRIDAGGRNAISTGLGYVGVTISALIAISAAGLDLSNLAIIAGALSVGVGFGMQAVVSNFVSGIILLIERPIKEGDWIEVSGHSGIVRKIAVRSTRIETFDRHDVIIPNSQLIAGTVMNMTLSSHTARLVIPITLPSRDNLEKAKGVLLEAVKERSDLLSYPAPEVLLIRMADKALDLELHCFLRDVTTTAATRSAILYAVSEGFAREGI